MQGFLGRVISSFRPQGALVREAMTVINAAADEFVLVSADEEVVLRHAGRLPEEERRVAGLQQESDEDETIAKEHDSQTDSTTGLHELEQDEDDEDVEGDEDDEDDDEDEEAEEDESDIEGDDQEDDEDEEEDEEGECCGAKPSPQSCDWAWFDILLVTFFATVLLLCVTSLVSEGVRGGNKDVQQQVEMERARLLWEVEEVKGMLLQQEMQQKHLQADMEQIRNTQRALHSQLMFLRQQQQAASRAGLQQHTLYHTSAADHEQVQKELEELRLRSGQVEEAVEHVMEMMSEQRDEGLELLDVFGTKLLRLESRVDWLVSELDLQDADPTLAGMEGEGGEWHAHHCC